MIVRCPLRCARPQSSLSPLHRRPAILRRHVASNAEPVEHRESASGSRAAQSTQSVLLSGLACLRLGSRVRQLRLSEPASVTARLRSTLAIGVDLRRSVFVVSCMRRLSNQTEGLQGEMLYHSRALAASRQPGSITNRGQSNAIPQTRP